jgi:hypothetical protein
MLLAAALKGEKGGVPTCEPACLCVTQCARALHVVNFELLPSSGMLDPEGQTLRACPMVFSETRLHAPASMTSSQKRQQHSWGLASAPSANAISCLPSTTHDQGQGFLE